MPTLPPETLDDVRTRYSRTRTGLKATISQPEIPGYRILELLGRGGMGTVYKAHETSTDRDVALKWLPRASDETYRKRFQREAKAAAALKHPAIVQVYSAGEIESGSFIVMELVDGFPLSMAFEARALGRNALLDLMQKVARALEAAHEKGILHRDLKPSNILVDEKGEPRIVDFGLARFTGEDSPATTALTREGVVLGTIGYMAPEVTTGGGSRAEKASDVFSLGAVFYEGLSGSPAFGDGKTSAVLRRMMSMDIKPLGDDIEHALKDLCMQMLAKEPQKRPLAGEVAARIETALKVEPFWLKVPKPVVALGAVALFSALLGAGAASLGHRRASGEGKAEVAAAPKDMESAKGSLSTIDLSNPETSSPSAPVASVPREANPVFTVKDVPPTGAAAETTARASGELGAVPEGPVGQGFTGNPGEAPASEVPTSQREVGEVANGASPVLQEDSAPKAKDAMPLSAPPKQGEADRVKKLLDQCFYEIKKSDPWLNDIRGQKAEAFVLGCQADIERRAAEIERVLPGALLDKRTASRLHMLRGRNALVAARGQDVKAEFYKTAKVELQRALEADPENSQALLYTGVLAFMIHDRVLFTQAQQGLHKGSSFEAKQAIEAMKQLKEIHRGARAGEIRAGLQDPILLMILISQHFRPVERSEPAPSGRERNRPPKDRKP